MRANVLSRSWCSAALVLGAALFASACKPAPAKPSADCTPQCEDRACQDDGCGGTCACDTKKPTPACTDTCESLHQECGEVCGEACGSCGESEVCTDGQCACRPVCDGTRCDDGCGGTCACGEGTECNGAGACVAPEQCKDTCKSTARTCGEVCGEACGSCGEGTACLKGSCVSAEGCTDCFLRLKVLERTVQDGQISEITLALDHAPSDGQPRPRMADVRIQADHEVELLSVDAGPALLDADKDLYVDESSGRPFRRRPDGSYQMLAYGFANTRTLEPGRVLTMKFRTHESGPIAFSLVRRAQVLAPPEADALLQGSSYDQPVVVSR